MLADKDGGIRGLVCIWCQNKRTFLEILLVGKDEQETVLHFAIVDDTVEFLSGFLHTGSIGRVDDEDETLGSCRTSNS